MNTTRFLTTTAAALFLCSQAQAGPPDPGDDGPLTVTRTEYNLGDTAFTPMGFPGPVELNAVVRYPDLSQGPYPLIIYLHGRHATCYNQGGLAILAWPCPSGFESIRSYLGYEYMQSVLASWGYIVVSIGANGINARDNSVFDLGMQARAELIQKHLDLWSDWNSPGGAPPFGTLFSGAVDLQNVGTMGHSRGGEGVAKHYVYNQSLGSPYGIVAVLPLAPVDFNRPDVTNVPLEVILPYCDGDVSDLQGVHLVDDVRYTPGDLTPKHTTLVMGANHNHFNTIWTPGGWPAGTADDWLAFVPGGPGDAWCGTVSGNHRLTPAQQRGMGKAYMNGFFRQYIGGEDFVALWKGDAPPPPSAMTTEIYQSYLPPDSPGTRLDVNRLLSAADLKVNFHGGAVTEDGLNPYDLCGGEAPQPQHCLPTPPQRTERQPHTVPSPRSSRRGLSQNRFGWDEPSAFLQNDLPGIDVSGLNVLQFRAAVNYLDSRNAGDQDFTVTLTDGSENSSSITVGEVSGSLFFPPGENLSCDPPPATCRPVPKVFLNTVRLPLSSFPGVDLTNIQSVRFDFNAQPTGALLMSDIQFAD